MRDRLAPALANRHGLITGATGTGKTVTLQVMAERFSAIGVPVFMADVKGDLAGISQAGASSVRLKARRWTSGAEERVRNDSMSYPQAAADPHPSLHATPYRDLLETLIAELRDRAY